MEQLKINILKEANESIGDVSLALDKSEKYFLTFAPWHLYPYKPSVQFSIAHNNKFIFLKYFVTEKFIRASSGNINGAVWEDSCVEFFISFDEKGYYNLECNCIGTLFIGFGKEKSGRKLLTEEMIKKIKFHSLIKSHADHLIQWELTLSIPLDIFVHHHFSSLQGKQCRMNFYKCGDALPEPHFLSWRNIESEEPNFHLPQFFGEAFFE